MEQVAEQSLFGGAITSSFPIRLKSVCQIREVPDNQEVFVDPTRDESILVELLELKSEVSDDRSATWFFQDLANEQDSPQQELESVSVLGPTDVPFLDPSVFKSVAIGKMALSKGRQGTEAANILRVYLANLRLRNVNTDVLITVYEPLYISALSESATVVGAGPTIPSSVAGVISAADIFQLILRTFKINDWGLFGNT